jgi:hypothetical protein
MEILAQAEHFPSCRAAKNQFFRGCFPGKTTQTLIPGATP